MQFVTSPDGLAALTVLAGAPPATVGHGGGVSSTPFVPCAGAPNGTCGAAHHPLSSFAPSPQATVVVERTTLWCGASQAEAADAIARAEATGASLSCSTAAE